MAQPPLRYVEAQPPAGVRVAGTLILLHAFPLNARMWEPQLVLAREGWRIIAPHMKGLDGAAGEAADTSFDAAAGSLVDLLDALHIESAVIGGLSMGGYLAFALYKWAARYVSALILADTRPDADTSQALEGRRRMLALLEQRGTSALADDLIPKLLGETTRQHRPDIVDRVRALAQASSPEATAGALTAIMTRADATALLKKIDCPTLILVGADDVVTPPGVSEDMHRAVARSELVMIPDAGHLSSLEQPQLFNAAVSRFLARAG